MNVPDDLKDAYRVFSTGKNVRPTAEEYVRLIERIGRLEDALRGIRDQVANGRLCYFGDHTGYMPQFSSEQVESWSAALNPPPASEKERVG